MTIDERHMRRALELAQAGVGLASPNPVVGAVVVDTSGQQVGSGTHTYDGVKHAEVLALEQAGTKSRGASLYFNLEPCSHQGRTGPCADAVILAGIVRVVCSMQDPNPQVAGKGFAKLRAAGIKVDVGLLEVEARKLNESFAVYIRSGKPLVTVKSAMSLDGKIASAVSPGQPPGALRAWLTGDEARAHVQKLRHQNDAILVGVGTIVTDDPLLTDRSGLPRRRKLLRVVLDSQLRIPLASQVVQTADDDVLVLCSVAAQDRKHALQERGVLVKEIPAERGGHPGSERPDFEAVIEALGKMQIASLLIEGGSLVNAAALSSGIVDKVFLYYAPKILGAGGVPFLAYANANTNVGWGAREVSVSRSALYHFGEDFAVEGYLRDPYAV